MKCGVVRCMLWSVVLSGACYRVWCCQVHATECGVVRCMLWSVVLSGACYGV